MRCKESYIVTQIVYEFFRRNIPFLRALVEQSGFENYDRRLCVSKIWILILDL